MDTNLFISFSFHPGLVFSLKCNIVFHSCNTPKWSSPETQSLRQHMYFMFLTGMAVVVSRKSVKNAYKTQIHSHTRTHMISRNTLPVWPTRRWLQCAHTSSFPSFYTYKLRWCRGKASDTYDGIFNISPSQGYFHFSPNSTSFKCCIYVHLSIWTKIFHNHVI